MPRTVQVKICGLTNLADAILARDAGADFLGFIFYPPSKRATTPATVRQIVTELRQWPNCPQLVGVFVNESAATVADLLDECQLDLAQLHGEETPNLINDPRSILYGRCYKALRPQTVAVAQIEAEWFIAEAPQVRPTLLIDAYHPQQYGGTGQLSDWEIGRELAQLTPGLMLAGGLTPANVWQAVQEVRPFAVDVASGVEASPGRKDATAVREFIASAKSVLLD
jgi:phosphoribosylanthranilate isomerase